MTNIKRTFILAVLTGSKCESKIKDAVLKIDGVKSVDVNHKTELAKVEFDNSVTSVEEISKVITSQGYKVIKLLDEASNLLSERILLENVDDAEDASTIRKKISNLKGVDAVEVDVKTEITTVKFDPKVISSQKIQSEIKKLGFGVFGAVDKQGKLKGSKASKKKGNQPAKKSSGIIIAIAGGVVAVVLAFVLIFDFGGEDYVNAATVEGDVQTVTSGMSPEGYEPITVQAGVPVEWTINVEEGDLTNCNSAIMIPEYGIEQELQVGENMIEFTPTETGTVEYTCWMNMLSSEIVVVDDLEDGSSKSAETSEVPAGDNCPENIVYLQKGVDAYYDDNGVYPENFDVLLEEGYIEKILECPGGNQYGIVDGVVVEQ